jgi:hypothetical protein
MKIKKSYTREEILDAGVIGLEFEFYSEMDEILETARSIGKFLKKRVIVPMTFTRLGKERPLYHSAVEPTDKIFKIEPDFSGGKKMCELITGKLSYKEARNTIIKMFEWIQNNGYTNNYCSVHINLSIDENKVPTLANIKNLSIAKFILSFNENKVFEYFPERKDNVYARSIKQIRPNNILFYQPTLSEFSKSTLSLPTTEKHYGVNFLKMTKNYLEYRYLGGAGYEKKGKKVLELLDYFIIHLHDVLNFVDFTDSERSEFKKMMDLDAKNYKGFIKYENFIKMFPEVAVTVDMKNAEEFVEAYWPNIRDSLYSLIITGKLRKGNFNYDTEVGRFQIHKAKLKNCRTDNIEFIECEVDGVFNNCYFYDCKITSSQLSNCIAARNNVIKISIISETQLPINNVCEDCYIKNKNIIINCEVKDGVIRSGEIGKLAKISKGTMII